MILRLATTGGQNTNHERDAVRPGSAADARGVSRHANVTTPTPLASTLSAPPAANQRMQFEWDPAKAAENLAQHGVSFEEAATVFRDPLSATGLDPDHSVGEERFIIFGVSSEGRLLIVAHTERGDTIRIISARPAAPSERQIYEEG